MNLPSRLIFIPRGIRVQLRKINEKLKAVSMPLVDEMTVELPTGELDPALAQELDHVLHQLFRYNEGDAGVQQDLGHKHQMLMEQAKAQGVSIECYDGCFQKDLDGAVLKVVTPRKEGDTDPLSRGSMPTLLDGLEEDVRLRLLSKATEIQTLIFDAKKFSSEQVTEWAKGHDFHVAKVDQTESSLRLRQRDPGDFQDDSFRTIALTEGVKAVIGNPKVQKAASTVAAPAINVNVNQIASSYDVAALAKDLGFILADDLKKVLREEDGKFCIYTADGSKKIACHPTKEEAIAQLRAIEANKNREKSMDAKQRLEAVLKSESLDEIRSFAKKAMEDLGMVATARVIGKREIKKTKGADGVETFELFIPIIKIDEEKRIVTGIVYEPDVEDAQGDSASAEEIEKACHGFMMDSQQIGLMHKANISDKVKLVENWLQKSDQWIGGLKVKKGTWLQSHKILDDAIWADVKTEKLTGFSMAGQAIDEAANSSK